MDQPETTINPSGSDKVDVLVRFSTLPFWAILELLALLCAWTLILPFPKATRAIMLWAHKRIPPAEWYFRKSNRGIDVKSPHMPVSGAKGVER